MTTIRQTLVQKLGQEISTAVTSVSVDSIPPDNKKQFWMLTAAVTAFRSELKNEAKKGSFEPGSDLLKQQASLVTKIAGDEKKASDKLVQTQQKLQAARELRDKINLEITQNKIDASALQLKQLVSDQLRNFDFNNAITELDKRIASRSCWAGLFSCCCDDGLDKKRKTLVKHQTTLSDSKSAPPTHDDAITLLEMHLANVEAEMKALEIAEAKNPTAANSTDEIQLDNINAQLIDAQSDDENNLLNNTMMAFVRLYRCITALADGLSDDPVPVPDEKTSLLSQPQVAKSSIKTQQLIGLSEKMSGYFDKFYTKIDETPLNANYFVEKVENEFSDSEKANLMNGTYSAISKKFFSLPTEEAAPELPRQAVA